MNRGGLMENSGSPIEDSGNPFRDSKSPIEEFGKKTNFGLLNLLKIASLGAKKTQLAKLAKNSKCACFLQLERSGNVPPSTI